jgi:hypothetical protein
MLETKDILNVAWLINVVVTGRFSNKILGYFKKILTAKNAPFYAVSLYGYLLQSNFNITWELAVSGNQT